MAGVVEKLSARELRADFLPYTESQRNRCNRLHTNKRERENMHVEDQTLKGSEPQLLLTMGTTKCS